MKRLFPYCFILFAGGIVAAQQQSVPHVHDNCEICAALLNDSIAAAS